MGYAESSPFTASYLRRSKLRPRFLGMFVKAARFSGVVKMLSIFGAPSRWRRSIL